VHTQATRKDRAIGVTPAEIASIARDKLCPAVRQKSALSEIRLRTIAERAKKAT